MKSLPLAFCALLVAGVALQPLVTGAIASETTVTAPAPRQDAPRRAGPLQTAVFAGGCFWGVEGVFERVQGVRAVRSGYAGGDARTAVYEIIGSGLTGHAEAVEIRYDPAQVSYGTLLRIFFSVAHDPTQLNRQGPDTGSQYRSAIFPQSAQQATLARAYIAQLSTAKLWPAKIVTTIEPGKPFFAAEGYHQNFLRNNPTYPYIVINDLPKVAALKTRFPQLFAARAAG
jgi:peptide-methionine (S)-S-oxide reductase